MSVFITRAKILTTEYPGFNVRHKIVTSPRVRCVRCVLCSFNVLVDEMVWLSLIHVLFYLNGVHRLRECTLCFWSAPRVISWRYPWRPWSNGDIAWNGRQYFLAKTIYRRAVDRRGQPIGGLQAETGHVSATHFSMHSVHSATR